MMRSSAAQIAKDEASTSASKEEVAPKEGKMRSLYSTPALYSLCSRTLFLTTSFLIAPNSLRVTLRYDLVGDSRHCSHAYAASESPETW